MKNITSANTEIYQMLEFCDKGFKDSIMTVLHKAITKKKKLQNISKKKIIDIREKMEIIELKNLIMEINKNKHKSCWICSKVKWR